MSADEWRRIERLFIAAIDRPEERREAFVRGAPEDPRVRREVLALLHTHTEPGRFDTLAEWLRGLRPADPIPSVEQFLERLRGSLADRYRIERELGRGGTALVLLVEDLRHRREVALKVLHSDIALGLGPDRFQHEIGLAAPLAHPHILPVYDSGEAGGHLYYVMPYVEGESLRARLAREGGVPPREALDIVRQVADGLEYAHRHGVVHCDVKPGNIMLHAGHAVVTDFGIARAMAAAEGDVLGELGIVQGTPAYMSPEQRTPGGRLGPPTDIYALGCVLYEMLVGSPPLPFRPEGADGGAARADRDRVLQSAGVPRTLRTVLARALAKDPAERFGSAAAFAEALSRASAGSPGRARRAAAGAGLLALAAVGLFSWARPSTMTHPAAAMIAVLPPAPTTPDSALVRLGRDLAVTLSANLDGVGEIRTVDAQTVLARAPGAGPIGLAEGSGLARRLGSSSVVHGSIVRAGPAVRVELGLFPTDGREALARVAVTSDPDDIGALTDSLTWRILRAVWRSRSPPTPNLAAITTRSVPALRAFLEGERAGLEGRWEAATASFARAMQEDPAFWLAHWRYAYSRWWYLQAVEDSILDPLYANRFSLPERDRLVLESWWSDSTSVALERSRDAIERYPGYWPAWMERADWLFHAGTLHGHDPEEARGALERTVALNPNFTPAWEHLYWATIGTDTMAAGRALEALTELGFGRATTAEFGFDLGRVYRAELDFARSGALNEPLLDSVASDLLGPARGRLGGGAILPQLQAELSRRVLEARPGPELMAVHERQLADALAARGAWDSALVVAERSARRAAGGDPIDAYRLAAIGSWLGALDPDVAERWGTRARITPRRQGPSPEVRAELAFLDGLLGARREDPGALAVARAAVRTSGASGRALLDRVLEGLEADLAGAPERAARILAELRRPGPDVLPSADDDHPFLLPVARLAAARLFREQGNASEARRAAVWFQALWALDGYRRGRSVLAANAALEEGRSLADLGYEELAVGAFRRFLARYDAPTSAHRDLIEEARFFVAPAGFR